MIISIVHADDRSPRIPTQEVLRTMTSSSVTIQWLLTCCYNSSQPEMFSILYGVVPGQIMRTPGIPASQTYSTQLNSLEPGTEYHYRIESKNRFEALFSDSMSFRTMDASEF